MTLELGTHVKYC